MTLQRALALFFGSQGLLVLDDFQNQLLENHVYVLVHSARSLVVPHLVLRHDLLHQVAGWLVCLQILLVTNQKPNEVRVNVLQDLGDPEVPESLQSLRLAQVEDEHEGVRVLVEGPRDGLELLLARSVPEGQTELLLSDLEDLELEVDSDGRLIVALELALGVLQQQRGFAHVAAADDADFDLLLLLVHRSIIFFFNLVIGLFMLREII